METVPVLRFDLLCAQYQVIDFMSFVDYQNPGWEYRTDEKLVIVGSLLSILDFTSISFPHGMLRE